MAAGNESTTIDNFAFARGDREKGKRRIGFPKLKNSTEVIRDVT